MVAEKVRGTEGFQDCQFNRYLEGRNFDWAASYAAEHGVGITSYVVELLEKAILVGDSEIIRSILVDTMESGKGDLVAQFLSTLSKAKNALCGVQDFVEQ